MRQSTFRLYGISVLSTALALMLWYLVTKRAGMSPYPLLLVAVMVVSWHGGREPGLLTTLLGLGAAAAAYAPPLDSPTHAFQLILFLLLALPVTYLNHRCRQLLHREQSSGAQVEHLATERGAILGQMTEAVIVVDPAARITFINQAARRLLYVDAEEGMDLAALVARMQLSRADGTDAVVEETALARALTGQTVSREEAVMQRPDGQRLVVQFSACKVTAPDGRELGAVATLRDVTAERLLEQEKMVIAAGIAHDLKNPLTTIKGTVQLLLAVTGRREWRPEGELDAGLRTIEAAATRMSDLIRELLEAGHRPEGRGEQQEKAVDLVALVRQVAHTYQPAAEHHVIQVEARTPDVTGVWNPGRVERIVGNLLSNAIKYSPAGGRIVVTVDREGHGRDAMALLTVCDQGLGIPEAERERIFAPYHRGSNVPAQVPGTGIGLAATRQLVERYGGSIVVSGRPGQGATFTVRLPLRPDGATSTWTAAEGKEATLGRIPR